MKQIFIFFVGFISLTVSAEVVTMDLSTATDMSGAPIEYGTEFRDELNRVIVHGVLHLIGYDDHCDEDIAEMRSKENYYLSLREVL